MRFLKPLLTLCLTAAFGASANAQLLSPLPQEVKQTEGELSISRPFTLVGEQTADHDAVATLKQGPFQFAAKGGVKLIIGERGDKAVKAYKKQIPEKAEGYYLKITPDEVVIAGADESGTFYGVQSLLQMLRTDKLPLVEITDFPSVECRGVIEGFYGNPWSHEDRLRQFDFYGKYKMNTYVFGPKDDPYHRARWREPYPAQEAARLKELVDAAHRNKVKFVWAIHPAGDIKWCLEDSVNVANKLEKMYDLGIRSFAVFFDDVWGEGARGEKQAGLLNYLTDVFVRKHSDVEPLIMCPSQYNKGWSHGDYLNTLGTQMYPEVRIMWTGNSVVDMIEANDMEWINSQIKRKAFIWLNYPVNDYCQSRLLMGKTYGNGLDIADMVSGFCSNPMEYAEASKVSLYSIADYTWNMPKYDSVKSWERALDALMPTAKYSFKLFCADNVDLGKTGHGLRREGESPLFAGQTHDDDRETYFAIRQQQAAQLLADSVNHPEMLREIKPWVESWSLLCHRGSLAISMGYSLEDHDSIAFIGRYKAYLKATQAQKAITSRDYEGSIVKAKPVVSGDVITPWIEEKVNSLVKNYRKQYTYGSDIFPVQSIADGEYFIKVNGLYLTDAQAAADRTGDRPEFQKDRDVINPQRQQWVIEQEPKTGRYKITNKQDGRYVNERGTFWANKANNPYDAQWHTFTLTKQDGKYSIQCGGDAGKKFWTLDGNHIGTTDAEQLIFDIEPVK